MSDFVARLARWASSFSGWSAEGKVFQLRGLEGPYSTALDRAVGQVQSVASTSTGCRIQFHLSTAAQIGPERTTSLVLIPRHLRFDDRVLLLLPIVVNVFLPEDESGQTEFVAIGTLRRLTN